MLNGSTSQHSLEWNSAAPYLQSASYDLVPARISYPIYHVQGRDVMPGLSDKYLSLATPIVCYWVYSLLWHFIDTAEIPYFEQYRIHEPEEVKRKNRVTRTTVVLMVVLQHLIQTALGWFWLEDDHAFLTDHRSEMQRYAAYTAKAAFALLGPRLGTKALRFGGQEFVSWMYWWGVPIMQFVWASFIMDTWQYFWHRAFHVNRFLYKHIHSVHHRLYCPYAYGALYNHPLEGFMLDTLGTVVAHAASFLSTRQDILLFGISTLKTVDDHCGFALPWDPFQLLFGNNVAYHDIHHQQFGIKRNFSQPYFTHWDVLLNTRMTPEQVPARIRDRYNAGPCADIAKADAAAALAAEAASVADDASSTASFSSERSTPDVVESRKDL